MKNFLTVDRRNWLILFFILLVTFIPFLGEALFNTKGEPREAIVAMSMLQQGDWVLPVSYGTDIPYKPPFFAWCIAAVSWLLGGEVTEFTSRLPSAVALIAMVMAVYSVFRRELRDSGSIPLMAAVVTFTSFEVFRAGYACRVDMVLTSCIVCAILAMYCYYRGGGKWLLPVAVLLMSCAVLTKGPVGAILPCLVVGLYLLSEGRGFWRVFLSMCVFGLLSLILPSLWYVAAYQAGGQEFYDLAMEENFGRFLGKMSYKSHANPVWYNFMTVITGFLPYTLLLLISLFGMRWKSIRCNCSVKESAKSLWRGFKAMQPVSRLSLIAAVSIFVFYCIPESKRSVYLLPIYPFVAYFIAIYMKRLVPIAPKAVKTFAFIIGLIALIAPMLLMVIKFGVLDGVGGQSMQRFVDGLMSVEVGVVGIIMLLLSLRSGFGLLYGVWRGKARDMMVQSCIAIVVIYWGFTSVYQPGVLNEKSDFPVAQQLEKLYGKESHVYSLVNDPMLRFYTINFYLGDRVRRFDKELPENGHLIVGEKDKDELLPKYSDQYEFKLMWNTDQKSCDVRQPIQVYRFSRK